MADGFAHLPAPSTLPRAQFLRLFSHVYPGAVWALEAIWPKVAAGELDRLGLVSAALRETIDGSDSGAKLAMLRSQPSASEAGGPPFAALASGERAYLTRFGFPFVMALRGASPSEAQAALAHRLTNPRPIEFETALAQAHRLASFRLAEIFSTGAT
jgi:2-oxo-4-hydroxy-4-carboxy--5-ureidoimidazoline (OHCU) decarboxylase